jgi:chorismate mutase/prephenate dehydratase
MELQDLRTKIDALDGELIRLLNERADLVCGVGEIKRAGGLDIYSPEREEKLLQALTARNQAQQGRLPGASLRAIYREIMSASLALEKDLAIAYFGPEATWTHQAARGKFGSSVRYVPQSSIGDVFDAVERERADYGVVPIENSTEGAVNHTLDVFIESDLLICAQLALKIEHHLLARVPRAAIRRVFSHPQVFGQCRHWLHRNLPEVDLIEVSSTARAGEMAAQTTDAGALAGPMVAELHGLSILDAGIQDSPHNTTRFLVVGHRDCPPTGNDRTSLMFGVPDRAGALFLALEPLQLAGVSMSKIESRPSKRKPWEYVFFVDVDGHREDTVLVGALRALQERCNFLKILGSYPQMTNPAESGGSPDLFHD